MIDTIRQISPRRRLLAGLLALSLVGTGIASFAAVSDQLTQTNELSVLSVDLKASTNGTTYSDALTVQWQVEGGVGNMNRKTIHLKNSGNGQASIRFTASGTGTASILSMVFRVYPDACSDTLSSPINNEAAASETIASANSTGGAGDTAVILAPGQTKELCMTATTSSTIPAGATATQTIIWTSSSNL